MTLVLAAIEPDTAFLVADTLLSSELQLLGDEGPVNGAKHALKIHILAEGNVAIAFAGDFATALSCIAELKARLDADPMLDPVSALTERIKQIVVSNSKNTPDFLILEIGTENRRLTKLTADGATQVKSAYIGSADEYAALRKMQQNLMYSLPTNQSTQKPDGTMVTEPFNETKGEREFAEIGLAMEQLTHSRKSQTVGAICGCVTRVVDARISRKFEYLQSKEASLTPWEGKAGFHFLASNSGCRGIGIYYDSGKFGFLMIAGDAEPCRKILAINLELFAEIANNEFGLNLE